MRDLAGAANSYKEGDYANRIKCLSIALVIFGLLSIVSPSVSLWAIATNPDADQQKQASIASNSLDLIAALAIFVASCAISYYGMYPEYAQKNQEKKTGTDPGDKPSDTSRKPAADLTNYQELTSDVVTGSDFRNKGLQRIGLGPSYDIKSPAIV